MESRDSECPRYLDPRWDNPEQRKELLAAGWSRTRRECDRCGTPRDIVEIPAWSGDSLQCPNCKDGVQAGVCDSKWAQDYFGNEGGLSGDAKERIIKGCDHVADCLLD